ncbi:imelysin family protein [Myxococcaceae bacterium GXIMD 01537]
MLRKTTLFRTLLLSGALALGACDSDDGEGTRSAVDAEVITTFTDHVVVPTYERLAARVATLDARVDALVASPSEANLTAAQEAWISAREPWEQSEGFLFGPVDTEGFDPTLDSWPLNQTDLDAVLASQDAFTPAYVGSLAKTQKGFHTVEFILFGSGRNRKVEQLSKRHYDYLKAISAELKAVSSDLASAWTKPGESRAPYRDILATAGQSGNAAYPSLDAAAQEVVGGILIILDEVANGKIADPFDAKDPELVESQYAWNSTTDFTNNLRSVENVYLGHLQGETPRGRALADVVKELKPELDTRIRAELAASVEALAQIPYPFRNAITDPAASDKIKAAQAAIRKLHDTFEADVKPLISG